ncbi:glycosyltransferase [Gemmobacter serpentinus]|uniref:glycosyltransferase n=1 Tax=Gemmobacter serpentinus TaxID=2652247 RepID=UPI001CF64D5F|nr:glycosyltransferase [Gemmobacter serpentinus]
MVDEFFDCDHYRHQTGLDLDRQGLMQHFRQTGDALGLDPSPYFATLWYKARYRNWARRGAATAFDDFLFRIGRGMERNPHPLIDGEFYRANHADLAAIGAKAPLHFMLHGDAEGRNPSGAFDAAFYRMCYLPLGTSHPFRHFSRHGATLGHLPRPAPKKPRRTHRAVRDAIRGLNRPLLLACHDAQAAGVPILTLDLATSLRARGYDPVFLLQRAGPLLPRFRAQGPTFVLAEGWAMDELAEALPARVPALINTAAMDAVALARTRSNCLLLVHEMADYIRDQGLLPGLRAAQAAGARIVVSMPSMVAALAPDLKDLTQIRPGIILPQTPMAAFRQIRRQMRGAGPVFISAGYADHRKGFDLFLAAARRIVAQRPQARFVWLGALGDWAQGLARQAQADGLDLILPGFTEHSLAWYRAADIYLLTSRQDPGPTTAMHAAAMGTAFVGYAADIGLIGQTEGVGTFLPAGAERAFSDAALAAAAAVTPSKRRALRRHLRAHSGFEPYVNALMARLAPGSGAAT